MIKMHSQKKVDNHRAGWEKNMFLRGGIWTTAGAVNALQSATPREGTQTHSMNNSVSLSTLQSLNCFLVCVCEDFSQAVRVILFSQQQFLQCSDKQ